MPQVATIYPPLPKLIPFHAAIGAHLFRSLTFTLTALDQCKHLGAATLLALGVARKMHAHVTTLVMSHALMTSKKQQHMRSRGKGAFVIYSVSAH